jgi:hypothetical protein
VICAAPRTAPAGNAGRTAAATGGHAAVVRMARPVIPRPGSARGRGNAPPRRVRMAVAPTASANRATPSKRVGRAGRLA